MARTPHGSRRVTWRNKELRRVISSRSALRSGCSSLESSLRLLRRGSRVVSVSWNFPRVSSPCASRTFSSRGAFASRRGRDVAGSYKYAAISRLEKEWNRARNSCFESLMPFWSISVRWSIGLVANKVEIELEHFIVSNVEFLFSTVSTRFLGRS